MENRCNPVTGYIAIQETVAVDPGTGQVGKGGAPFYLTLSKQLGDQDDVIMLADGNTQVIVDAPL